MERPRNLVGRLAGTLAGGITGYFIFIWAAQHGFYALMLPGAFAGAGASLLVTDRSVLRAVLCAAFGLGLGLFAEWRFAPFIADKGLGYFLAHLHQLQTLTLLMVAGGSVLGGWLALGRQRASQPG